MSLLGQNRKSSMRANVFRCSPNNGHCQDTSACPFRARPQEWRNQTPWQRRAQPRPAGGGPAEWIANQITEACGWEQAPRYLIRDRDRAYGEVFIQRMRSIGIRDRPTSPRSPWQNGYAERLIGSIRRECLDHVVVFGERHLRHVLLSYVKYYNEVRTHLSLNKDAPATRSVQRTGRILCRPILGGLHHQYVRI